ncbi:MAG: phytanoyl-CoA dioxygenase family protein [Chitinophagales bacterium]|nr:phytanoyl-CoA dioxygenase family protein [Chitinophagales bacterium]
MAPQTFIDSQHQAFFDEQGFIVLDVLEQNQLEALKLLFQETYFANNNPRSNFNAVSDKERNNLIRLESIRILAPSFNKVFKNYINNGATFFLKQPSQGELGLHQDSTMVDFSEDFACYAWTPLQDVNEHNGCMFIIPKSHLFFKNYNSFTYRNTEIYLKEVVPDAIKKIEMKAGEILFYDNRLFHGSFANQSSELRIAMNMLIVSDKAKLRYYQKKNDFFTSEYHATAESFLNSHDVYAKGLLPEGAEFIRDIPYTHHFVTAKDINKANKQFDVNSKPLKKWWRQVLTKYF